MLPGYVIGRNFKKIRYPSEEKWSYILWEEDSPHMGDGTSLERKGGVLQRVSMGCW